MALVDLAADPRFANTRLVVIDFETLTPAGRPPEPIEVAAVILGCGPSAELAQTARFESVMRPPEDVPITWRDQATGLTAATLAGAAPASEVMARLDQLLAEDPASAYRLVAHNASTERALIFAQHAHCPVLAATPLLDTVRLARRTLTGLTRHGLDDLAHYWGIPIPPGRHRAMADAELTATLLTRLLDHGPWRSLHDLERDARLEPKQPEAPATDQGSLF